MIVFTETFSKLKHRDWGGGLFSFYQWQQPLFSYWCGKHECLSLLVAIQYNPGILHSSCIGFLPVRAGKIIKDFKCHVPLLPLQAHAYAHMHTHTHTHSPLVKKLEPACSQSMMGHEDIRTWMHAIVLQSLFFFSRSMQPCPRCFSLVHHHFLGSCQDGLFVSFSWGKEAWLKSPLLPHQIPPETVSHLHPCARTKVSRDFWLEKHCISRALEQLKLTVATETLIYFELVSHKIQERGSKFILITRPGRLWISEAFSKDGKMAAAPQSPFSELATIVSWVVKTFKGALLNLKCQCKFILAQGHVKSSARWGWHSVKIKMLGFFLKGESVIF